MTETPGPRASLAGKLDASVLCEPLCEHARQTDEGKLTHPPFSVIASLFCAAIWVSPQARSDCFVADTSRNDDKKEMRWVCKQTHHSQRLKKRKPVLLAMAGNLIG